MNICGIYKGKGGDMLGDLKKIEKTIKEGKKILVERPEFLNMEIEDVLSELDDGTDEMLHNRWGVAAWVIVETLKGFDSKILVERLSRVRSGIFAYEYAIYILQKDNIINVEEILLEAEQQGKFDEIVSYVSKNIIYKAKTEKQYFLEILDVLDKHKDNRNYYMFLGNYAKYIVAIGMEQKAEKLLGDLKDQSQYDFMYNMQKEWYEKDASEVDKVIGRMLERKSEWSKKAFIDLLETSLYYGDEQFDYYFIKTENLISENEDFQQRIIPAFVKYITNNYGKDDIASDFKYKQVIEFLEKVPEQSAKLKLKFVQTVYIIDKMPDTLKDIFLKIITTSFDKEQNILNIVSGYLYRELRKGDWEIVLQLMFKVFAANNYLEDFEQYFKVMESISTMLTNHIGEVMVEVVKYLLEGGKERFFFGLGLLKEIGDFKSLYNVGDGDALLIINDAQRIRLVKGALYYFIVESKKICEMVFQLMEFPTESGDEYVKFCMQEVYENYPMAMTNVAKKYAVANNKSQASLAKEVLSAYEKKSMEQKGNYKIKDLKISSEHQNIYQRAMNEQNKMINKKANAESAFFGFFKSRNLKYGERYAHITIGRKNEKSYQINRYTKHKYEAEMPGQYVRDPVKYMLKKSSFFREVVLDEISD